MNKKRVEEYSPALFVLAPDRRTDGVADQPFREGADRLVNFSL